MNKNDNLHILFKTLTDILPYEFNEKFIDGQPTEASIVITKEDSDRIMLISGNNDFAVSIYADEDDDKPRETFSWATEDEETTIESIVSCIKACL